MLDDGEIDFWFSLNLVDRIQGKGKIAWRDETKKEAGIRFATEDNDALAEIRDWMKEAVSPEPAHTHADFFTLGAIPEIVPQQHTTQNTENAEKSESIAVAKMELPAAKATEVAKNLAEADAKIFEDKETFPQQRVRTPAVSIPSLLDDEVKPLFPVKTEEKDIASRLRWRFVSGVFAGMLVTAALVASAFYFLVEPQRNIEQKINSNTAAVANHSPEQTSEPISENQNNAAGTSDNSKKSSETKNTTPQILLKNIPTSGVPDTLLSSAASTPVLQNSVNVKNSTKTHMTPSQLWVEIASGNTSAEVSLGEMYAKGDGVEKNCEQARVLFKAAWAKGNTDGQKKLDNLNQNGCS